MTLKMHMMAPARLVLTPGTLAAALLCCHLGAAHGETSPWYLGVSQTLTHDSNVYRLNDGQTLNPQLSKADLVSGTALVGGIDQSFGRQRLYGSGNVRENRFNDNKNLNNQSYSLNLGLDWQTVQRISGTLSASLDKSMARFDERIVDGALQTSPNEQRTGAFDARIQMGTVTRLTWEASLGYRTRRFSAAAYDRWEYDQNSASVGARFRPSNLLNIGAGLRWTRSQYPRYAQVLVFDENNLPIGTQTIADTQRRIDLDLTAGWQPSGASFLNARLSPTRIRYGKNTAANFSGLTGGLNWGWQATGKTRFDTSLSRDSGQSSDALLSASADQIRSVDTSQVNTMLGLKASHQLTGKIALNAGIQVGTRSLRRTDSITATVRTGSERPTILTLGGKWLPTRSTQVGCDLSAESRKGSGVGSTLSYTTISCAGQIVLQ